MKLRAAGAPERETPVPSGMRKQIASAMVPSTTAPHVTEFVTVDVTRSMELLGRLRTSPHSRDCR